VLLDIGLIGAGSPGVPILTGSAAHVVAEALGWAATGAMFAAAIGLIPTWGHA
jgi:hypothetical protein